LTARLADVEVAPGKVVHAWTYDGGLPGPLIKTTVGDRLIVHFKNELTAVAHCQRRQEPVLLS
jgi:FtsP/CotA-like multicopper oxidase with cupredoxin domain